MILTGGDPLVLSARRLREVMKRARAQIEHVKVVRIHTRVPVAEPARVDGGTGAGAQGQAASRPTSPCTSTIRAN